MAETSHQIRHDLELTRERVSDTIVALERKVNPRYVLRDHPLAVVGVAFGTGVLLATTGAAGRAATGVKEQITDGATNVNARASNALDALVRSILGAASAAIATKLSDVLEGAVTGVAPATRTTAPRALPAGSAVSVRAA